MPRMSYVPIPLARTSSEAFSKEASNTKLTNWFAERNPEGSKSPFTLYPTPGLKAWTTVGEGPIRGLHLAGPDLFVVSGAKLYKVNSAKAVTELGTVGSSGAVRMISNDLREVAVVTRNKSYAYTANGLIQLPETGLNGAAYQDGYGIFTQSSSQKFWITDIDDMATIGGTAFSSADALTGNVIGCISDHRELWIFKETSIEVWYNSGNALFPFDRAQGGVIEKGCAASGSIAKAQNAVFWLGEDLRVYMAAGYQPKPISTPQIDARLADKTATFQDAEAFTYSQNGHEFYVLLLSDLTLVYDLTEGVWHERKHLGLQRWRPNCYSNAFNLHLVGDYSNNQIYELSDTTYDDDGDALRREAILPALFSAGELLTVWQMFLDFEGGVGLTTGQGSDPQVMLDWSDDGGNTWSNELTTSIGKIGKYDHRAMFARLGTFRERQFRIAISDPVKAVISGAYAKVSQRVQ